VAVSDQHSHSPRSAQWSTRGHDLSVLCWRWRIVAGDLVAIAQIRTVDHQYLLIGGLAAAILIAPRIEGEVVLGTLRLCFDRLVTSVGAVGVATKPMDLRATIASRQEFKRPLQTLTLTVPRRWLRGVATASLWVTHEACVARVTL